MSYNNDPTSTILPLLFVVLIIVLMWLIPTRYDDVTLTARKYISGYKYEGCSGCVINCESDTDHLADDSNDWYKCKVEDYKNKINFVVKCNAKGFRDSCYIFNN